jgi:nucleoid DNA-binding protein
MTKQQLVEKVAEKAGKSRSETESVLELLLSTISDGLQAGERIDLRGFGSFSVKEKKARQGRNPRTGEAIAIPAKRDAGFKAGKELVVKLAEPATSQEGQSAEPFSNPG